MGSLILAVYKAHLQPVIPESTLLFSEKVVKIKSSCNEMSTVASAKSHPNT